MILLQATGWRFKKPAKMVMYSFKCLHFLSLVFSDSCFKAIFRLLLGYGCSTSTKQGYEFYKATYGNPFVANDAMTKLYIGET